jgi:hypothetical protein
MTEVLENIDVIGRRPGVDRRGDEVLTDINVIGRTPGSAPRDAELLEGIDVIGRSRPKSQSKHLYYPLNLGDPTGGFKNAVRFIAYAQKRSFLDDPNETPTFRNPPDQYDGRVRTFPVTQGAFNTSFLFRSSLVQGSRFNIGSVVEDLVGIGFNGLEFFTSGQQTNYGRRTVELDSSITLYMPDTVINQDKHDYQPISINQASGRAGLYTAGFPAAVGGLGSPLGRTEVFAELAGRAGIFGSRSTEAILAGLGYALNPMLEMTYGGTQPRSFLFQFRFAPRNLKEAEEVKKIIKTFRFHSHSENAGGQGTIAEGSGTRYLVPPNHFEIQFLRRDSTGRFVENLAMPRVTTCMVASINTNYAAQLDTFATHQDGTPVSISLDLEFIESVILTKNDIKNGY